MWWIVLHVVKGVVDGHCSTSIAILCSLTFAKQKKIGKFCKVEQKTTVFLPGTNQFAQKSWTAETEKDSQIFRLSHHKTFQFGKVMNLV